MDKIIFSNGAEGQKDDKALSQIKCNFRQPLSTAFVFRCFQDYH